MYRMVLSRMTLKQIRNYLGLRLAAFLLVFTLILTPTLAVAAPAATTGECQGVPTAVIKNCPNVGTQDDDNGILVLLVIALQIMTAGVGIVAVGGIIYGGILYASAGDSSEKVKKSIEVIRNVIIGILAYVAMYALLNFLIPGGIFT